LGSSMNTVEHSLTRKPPGYDTERLVGFHLGRQEPWWPMRRAKQIRSSAVGCCNSVPRQKIGEV
jgi:hypothetical protein